MMSVAPKISKGVTLYTAGTPNGWKIGVLVKELAKELPCEVKKISIGANEQKEPWFLKVNPNGRIPAVVDHDNSDFAVFESGAIMMYLADKAGQFYPTDWNKRSEVNQWLYFMNAGVGPMQGQANHFVRFAPEQIEYAQNRYINETNRLYSVLEDRLKDHDYLAADEYTIADMATFCWVVAAPFAGIDYRKYPAVDAWVKRIAARPAVLEGLAVPEPSPLTASLTDPAAMDAMIKESQEKWVKKPE